MFGGKGNRGTSGGKSVFVGGGVEAGKKRSFCVG